MEPQTSRYWKQKQMYFETILVNNGPEYADELTIISVSAVFPDGLGQFRQWKRTQDSILVWRKDSRIREGSARVQYGVEAFEKVERRCGRGCGCGTLKA